MMRGTAVFTCVLVALLALAVSPIAAPLLELQESMFDFGYAPQNSQISHVFWLKSIGTDSLKITKVIPGCGCTQAPIEKSDLGPGDSTRLEIIFNTKSYSGAISKSPRIETNTGDSIIRVQIKANCLVRPDSTYPVQFTPYKVDISQFGETVRNEMAFTITNVSDTNLTVTLVYEPAGLFDVTLPKEVKAGKTEQGKVILRPEALEQSFEKSFTVQVGDAAKTRFTVPVKRTVKSPELSQTATDSAGK
jgi:hypothetical protein